MFSAVQTFLPAVWQWEKAHAGPRGHVHAPQRVLVPEYAGAPANHRRSCGQPDTSALEQFHLTNQFVRRGLAGDPVNGPLRERTYRELAEALRSRIEPILREWEGLVRTHVPPASDVSFAEVLDHLPEILNNMADALFSDDVLEINHLFQRSPEQGIHRFQLHYDVTQLATEDRMLRRLILEHVDDALGRRKTIEEETALNWAIDLMGQQAMVAFVGHQNQRLRETAEAELRYLSFLSHDLNGNLNNISLSLHILRQRLARGRDSPLMLSYWSRNAGHCRNDAGNGETAAG